MSSLHHRPAARGAPPARLRLETLECRVVPTTNLVLDFAGGTVPNSPDYSTVTRPDVNFGAFTAIPNTDGTPGDRTQQILQIVAGVRKDYAPFDVNVVWDDGGVNSPFFNAANHDSVIYVVSNDPQSVGQDAGTFGVAPYLPKRDLGAVGLTFEPVHTGTPIRQLRDLTDTVAHEAGHTFGLDHSTQSDSQRRQLVTTATQDPNLASRFSPEVLPTEDGESYAEADRLTQNVGANPNKPNDPQTNLTLVADTPTVVTSAASLVSINGTVAFAGDRAAFQFTAPITGSMTVIEQAAAGSTLNPVVTVWDAQGKLIGVGQPGTSTVTFNATVGQTYYAVVGSAFDQQMAVSASPTQTPAGGSVGGYVLEIGPTADTSMPVVPATETPATHTGGTEQPAPATVYQKDKGADQPSALTPQQQQAQQNQQINQLVIANYQAVLAQPLPPELAFAMIASLADINGDGFADVTVLIGVKVGTGRNARTEVFQITFDGLSPSGAILGSPQVIGIF